MWGYVLLGFAAVAAACGHLWWQRRYARLREELCAQRLSCSTFRQQHDHLFTQQSAQLQALFNSMTEGVLVLEASGRIQLANQSLQRLVGLTSDVRGQTVLEAFRMKELSDLVKRLPAERTVSGFELEMLGLDERWLQINAAAVLDRAGNASGAILVFHDLTRLKHLESTRKEFVANVSHELRTPLSLIKGFVETLLEGAKDDPENATRFLQTIERHTDRLTFLIEDLLTISRLESGQIVMNLQPVDLREEAQRAIDDLRARTDSRNVTIENQVPAGLTARADADRLEQVLYNLIENAVKYGRAEGCIWIGARPAKENRIEVWVKDDGPGIPPEAIERIFERFYRVDRARSRETGGTGLGLSIVKHIVQAHGGEVSARSDPGHGAIFSFTLPRG